MPVDLKIARPFTLVGADNKLYAYGIGLYPGVSDEIAAMPYVQWHTMDACLARGAWIAQQRWTTPAVGQLTPAFIWLRPENPLVTIDIEAGWEPVYQDSKHIEFFPRLDVPQPDALHVYTDPVTGEKGYRLTQRPDVFRNQPFTFSDDVIRVRPGDVSPPVRGASPPLPRTPAGDVSASPVSWSPAAGAAFHAMMQASIADAQRAQSAAMIPQPSTATPRVLAPQHATGIPLTPTPKRMDQHQFFDIDRRTTPVAPKPVQAPPPSDAGRTVVPIHIVREERLRAKLERRPIRAWARAA